MDASTQWIEVFPDVRLEVDVATGEARQVVSAVAQADWVEYNLTAHRKPTALVHAGRVYHIVEATQSPEGWRYTLEPWIAGARIWRRVELSREAWERERAAQQEEQRRRVNWQVGRLLTLVAGFLPAHLQIELSHTHGVRPATATAINAAMSFMLATLATGAAMGSKNLMMLAFVLVWLMTAIARLAGAMTSGVACAPMPIEAAARLWFVFSGKRPDHDEFEEME